MMHIMTAIESEWACIAHSSIFTSFSGLTRDDCMS
jgi:hypothetical protein